jgi:hypothetical protein
MTESLVQTMMVWVAATIRRNPRPSDHHTRQDFTSPCLLWQASEASNRWFNSDPWTSCTTKLQNARFEASEPRHIEFASWLLLTMIIEIFPSRLCIISLQLELWLFVVLL